MVRHCRGVLPNNTLACLYGLTEDVRQKRVLSDVDIRTHIADEAVQKVPLQRMTRMNRRSGDRVVVSLDGVQTNQLSSVLGPYAQRIRKPRDQSDGALPQPGQTLAVLLWVRLRLAK